MNILLQLFLVFFQIGAVSFGGGYGMISMLREKVLEFGWLSEEEFLNLIAVSESTPGPIAINMATFVGSTQAGFLGSLCATIGAVLPSLIIILIIAALVKNILNYGGVRAFLDGVRPSVVGLIIATALTMLLSTVFGVTTIDGGFAFSLVDLVIFLILVTVSLIFIKWKKKMPSPILMILFSALIGIVIGYGEELIGSM